MKAPLYWMLFNAQLVQLQNMSFFTNFPQIQPTEQNLEFQEIHIFP